jgi:serine/threonine protein kinase
VDTETDRPVAIKIFFAPRIERKIKNGLRRIYDEYDLVKGLSHEGVVRYYDLFESGQKVYLVMELGGVGLDVLKESSVEPLAPEFMKSVMRQLLGVLVYLESRGVTHHDIKPSNILVSSPGPKVLLCDFGVAERHGGGPCTSFFGSPAFQAPEIAGNVGGEEYDGAKADLWSAGVVLFFMATGGYPFNGDTVYLLLKSIDEDPVVLPSDLDPLLYDLLLSIGYVVITASHALIMVGLLQKDPLKRISAGEALEHPWFTASGSTTVVCHTMWSALRRLFCA